MRGDLFDDLVVCGNTGTRSPSVRTLPLSLALHGMAVAALATLSVTAVREGPLRAAAVVFHPSPRPEPSAAPSVAGGTPGTTRRGQAPPVVVDPRPPIVSGAPIDVETDLLDAPVGDAPICLSGCAPNASGSADTRGLPVPGGTGEGPGPLRPGGDIQEPRRIRGTVPVYPDLARRAHVEGKVVLECVIDEDGRVTDLRVMSGHPLLADAAKDAVGRWVYTPTRLNGQPVRVILTVTVKFELARN
jgi:periplasmic protein TonB